MILNQLESLCKNFKFIASIRAGEGEAFAVFTDATKPACDDTIRKIPAGHIRRFVETNTRPPVRYDFQLKETEIFLAYESLFGAMPKSRQPKSLVAK